MSFNLLFVNTLFAILFTQVKSTYDYNTSNVCDSGSTGYSQNQVAYMCSHQALGSCNLQQAAVADGYSSFAEYGFGGYGSNPNSSCCRCFQVQITDASAPTKDLIVQGINTGGDVTGGQIDLSMIAGGFGANNGCANKVYAWNGSAWDGRAGAAQYPTSQAGNWCSDPNGDNTQCNNAYSGGIRTRADCSKLPNANLISLCQYSFDTNWRIPSTGQRNTLMKEVRCPAGLIALSGCNKDDPTLPYPSGKLVAGASGVTTGTLTTMWDCCKPSCSWTSNVSNASGTAVMSCDASGNVLGLGSPLSCQTLTCDATCKSCSASNDSTKCTSCNSGYYLSANPGSCVVCPTALNCTTCSNSTTCTACKTGYTLQANGTCTLPCDSSCTTCSTPQSSTSCTGCNSGYYLSANPGSCVVCPSALNCTTCSNSTTCTGCKSGYTLSNGVCQPPCDSSCASCSTPQSATSCTSCPTGYYLNGSTVGSCVSCPSSLNCTNCASATTCNSCNTNYTLQANKTCLPGCDSSCSTCSSPLDSTKCTSCKNGYYLNGSSVGSCVQCPTNCSACTNASTCSACTNNTILINSACQACTSPCSTCQTTTTTCTTCISGYSLSGNTCNQQASAGNCDSSCVTCSKSNDQNACTSCPSGKLVLGGNCQPCQPVCAECSGNPNSCTACPANYALSGTTCVGNNQDQTKCYSTCKTCSVQNDQNACTTCFDGYLILGNNNCQPCQPQCKTCSGDPNNCTACASGYGMQNGKCVTVISDNSSCYSTCATCNQPNNQNQCVTCASGFILASDNSCQSCKSPCQTCSGSQDSCTSCITNYTLTGTTCTSPFNQTVKAAAGTTSSNLFHFELLVLLISFIVINF